MTGYNKYHLYDLMKWSQVINICLLFYKDKIEKQNLSIQRTVKWNT